MEKETLLVFYHQTVKRTKVLAGCVTLNTADAVAAPGSKRSISHRCQFGDGTPKCFGNRAFPFPGPALQHNSCVGDLCRNTVPGDRGGLIFNVSCSVLAPSQQYIARNWTSHPRQKTPVFGQPAQPDAPLGA